MILALLYNLLQCQNIVKNDSIYTPHLIDGRYGWYLFLVSKGISNLPLLNGPMD